MPIKHEEAEMLGCKQTNRWWNRSNKNQPNLTSITFQSSAFALFEVFH